MLAEHLIALETAVADLGTLYTVARSFALLESRAEAELLPLLGNFAARLRSLRRAEQLTESAIENAAREIHTIGTRWRSELEHVRRSAVYQGACRAFAADAQAELAASIPAVFAGLRVVAPTGPIYLPVSPATGRHRPGASPFLSSDACADKIARLLGEGIAPETTGSEWWDLDLPAIFGADDAAALESPIALELEPSDVHVIVFGIADGLGYRIFTPCLQAPMRVVLAADVADEWWEAYEDGYPPFRDALRQALATRGCSVRVAGC